jgi:exodeoxyribonuclease V alpha subunit
MSQMTFGFDEREPEQPRKHKEPLKEPVQALEGTEVEMKTQPLLDFLLETKRIRLVDVKLAELLIGTDTSQKNEVFYLILLLAVAQQSQHSCLDLNAINWQNPFAIREQAVSEASIAAPDIISPFSENYDAQQAETQLMAAACVGDDKPLLLFANKLYFARLAQYETVLASRLSHLAAKPLNIDETALTALLTEYFPDEAHREDPADPIKTLNWQKVACAIAATKGFSVITGGPGTGKTTTVTKLLAIMQSLYASAPLTIKLVAPTGKAAARLSESILGAKQKLSMIPKDIAPLIPETAQTIHRLLGVIPHTNKFRHNKRNPLHLDVLIIDEASMVDLSLMAKLIEALPSHARLILLGDKDQLASVDTGSILSDLCQGLTLEKMPAYSQARAEQLNRVCFNNRAVLSHSEDSYLLSDCIAFLQQSYRFDGKSGIGQLAQAVNTNSQGLLGYVEQTVNEGGFSDLKLNYNVINKPIEHFVQLAAQHYQAYLTLIREGAGVAKVHNAFSDYQLLAAVKEGDYGVNSLNLRIEKALSQQGLISPYQRHYLGMPIMISQNDYQLKLFNGDIGILMHDEQGQLKAMFIDEQENIRAFSPARLPAHDKVYAMTIHKSQGSEFAYTAMILPPINQANQGINRQLVYTGITRAKNTFELVADKNVLLMAMNKSVTRASGLFDRLKHAAS